MTIVFIGDIHQHWHYIDAGLAAQLTLPKAAVLLGDIQCERPLDELAALQQFAIGDFAPDLTLILDLPVKTGFARGRYDARIDDGLTLIGCMITNAVRCAPPGNQPTPGEQAACRPFLAARIAALPRLEVIVTLGDVARRNRFAG